jgi:SOS-response transcriptional repressor LexA
MSETDVRPSKKQRELLTFIEGFIAQHGYGPSYREIMRALDYKSVSTVAVHVDNLIKKGHLRKRDKSARSLEVCAETPKSASSVAKPVTQAQEKWLMDAVGARFAAAEKQAANVAELDALYVLVGALHVLGFPDAARSYQSRLQDLRTQLGSAK